MKRKPLTLDSDELEALNEAEREDHPRRSRIAFKRPKTRKDCEHIPRPCPFVGCTHNLYLEVRNQSIIIYHPDKEPWEVDPKWSCVLDVVEGGRNLTLEQIGKVLNVTRERVRQMVDAGIDDVRYATTGIRDFIGSDYADSNRWEEDSIVSGEDFDESCFDLGSDPLPF